MEKIQEEKDVPLKEMDNIDEIRGDPIKNMEIKKPLNTLVIQNDEVLMRTKIKTAFFITFFVLILVYFFYSKIKLLTSPVPSKTIDYSQYSWYMIPVWYLWNYILHAWNSLLLSFLLAGFIHEFIPEDYIKKVLGTGKFRDYLIAAALAPVFITCSCSVIPIYVGILMSGATIGVTMTFFLMAPAANFITIMMTGEYVGWDLGIWRLVFSFLAAVLSGWIFDHLKMSKELGLKYKKMTAGSLNQMKIERTIHDKIGDAYNFSWKLAKQIIPLLTAGLVIVSYLAAYMPDEWVTLYFTGITGIVIAALLGGPLYTPTLVEIVLTRALLDKGMSRATALSFMMGQPYDIVSMVPNSKYFGWRGIIIYTIVFFVASILSALLYGVVVGNF
ncbi:MAG: permease [Promethearchaeota archaeon]